MNKFYYLLLVWFVATCCAVSRADEPKDKSVYVPMCLERRCKPPKRNAIYLLTGPVPDSVSKTARGFGGLGYFYQLKDDMEVGGIVLGTDRGIFGWALGVGGRF